VVSRFWDFKVLGFLDLMGFFEILGFLGFWFWAMGLGWKVYAFLFSVLGFKALCGIYG
jgi:hypothetical protein